MQSGQPDSPNITRHVPTPESPGSHQSLLLLGAGEFPNTAAFPTDLSRDGCFSCFGNLRRCCFCITVIKLPHPQPNSPAWWAMGRMNPCAICSPGHQHGQQKLRVVNILEADPSLLLSVPSDTPASMEILFQLLILVVIQFPTQWLTGCLTPLLFSWCKSSATGHFQSTTMWQFLRIWGCGRLELSNQTIWIQIA